MIRAAVITVSDKGARGEREDRSGPIVRDTLSKQGIEVAQMRIVPDDRYMLERVLRSLVEEVDLIVTSGGTGIGPRDVTPEVTRAVVEKELPGFGEAMRLAGLQKTPHSILSRGLAGVCHRCLLLNLPGSPKGAQESLEAVLPALPHAIELVRGEAGECGREDDSTR